MHLVYALLNFLGRGKCNFMDKRIWAFLARDSQFTLMIQHGLVVLVTGSLCNLTAKGPKHKDAVFYDMSCEPFSPLQPSKMPETPNLSKNLSQRLFWGVPVRGTEIWKNLSKFVRKLPFFKF